MTPSQKRITEDEIQRIATNAIREVQGETTTDLETRIDAMVYELNDEKIAVVEERG